MATAKHRLIELIHYCTSCEECHDEDIAVHLLAHDVSVPPVHIGQTVYLVRRPWRSPPFISEETVEWARIEYTADGLIRKFGNRSFEAYDIDLGETVFLTYKKAQAALKEG